MLNSFKLIILILRTRLEQIFKVSIDIATNQISYYPKQVKLLEKEFKKYTNSSESLMFCNATSALEAALFAGGIDRDSIVGSTSFVIPSSYSSAKSLDAKIEFFDIDPDTLNINVNNLIQEDSKLSAVIITHFYGNPCDIEKIMKWAKKHNIFVVEDCSHAHGATYKGIPLGAWGDVGIFSLQGAKAISAGEGAIAVSNSSDLIYKMAAYGHQESYKKFGIEVQHQDDLPSFGYGKKMRAHPLGASLAITELKKIDSKNSIFSSWFFELSLLLDSNACFKLPKILSEAKIGGFCQGLPIIIKDNETANKLNKKLLDNKINCFRRSYTNPLIEFSYKLNTELDISNTLPHSYNNFTRVIFVPFYQFILPWRWKRLKVILKNWTNE